MTAILVVDDDDDVVSLIQVAFQLAGGWRVTTAGSVSSATEEFKRSTFDVVLTDNQLGDGSAADVALQAAGCPVVVLSGSVEGPVSTMVSFPGFAGGISKPFDPMTLPALVASALPLKAGAVPSDDDPSGMESAAENAVGQQVRGP